MYQRVASMPLAYMLLWVGSLALSIALVVLLRTRWGQSRPLHKCAILSLLVHLMLAWAAMTVRMIAGEGRGDSGPTIRVRVVRDPQSVEPLASIEKPSAEEEAPRLLEPPEEEVETPAEVKAVASVDKPEDAEQEIEATEPKPEDSIAESETPTDTQPKVEQENAAANVTDIAANNSTESEIPTPEEVTDAANDSIRGEPTDSAVVAESPPMPEVTKVATVASTPYSHRAAPGRLGLVERQGGNAQTEAAVAAALRWLAAAQAKDGRWDASQHGAGQEYAVLGHNRHGAGRDADTGISALAVLAFLGAGHSHLDGQYQDTVRRGLDFLLRSQSADGSLFGNATIYAQMYCHSMATFALAEAMAMSGDARLEPAVGRAVGFSLSAQNANTGGWRYRAGDAGDTSQLGWQMMALASAERAGVEVPSHTWVRVERFLRSVRRGNHGGLASYRPDSGPSTPMCAEALYCRLLLTETLGVAIDQPADAEAARQLLTALPEAERVNLYYWYYGTLALHHRRQQSEDAESHWQTWNAALTKALLSTQESSGREVGSWSPHTVWGGYGGRVYTTAMAAMCLEVYYRYLPVAVPSDRWMATRPEPLPNTR